jgi:tRNA (cytidine32/uridine32-2'-O)-methyltransferase
MCTNIRIVLVETSHPGNIGAVARAMKTMGLQSLYLVRPKTFPSAESTARASGADDLLERAQVRDDLVQAVAGCRLVVGTSARRRTVEWPELTPRETARRLLGDAALGAVALVFGRESSGLTNEELALCHYLTHVPTNPEFSSLNVAAAVQLFAYELRMATLDGTATPGEEREVAGAEALEGLLGHLQQTLLEIGFAAPQQSKKLMRRLRRLFNRARPDRDEINILRGILSAAQYLARRSSASRQGGQGADGGQEGI